MPELPEIEHLKRTLEPHLRGARVTSVRIYRADVVRRAPRPVATDSPTSSRRASLTGCRIRTLRRHGKQLAIISHEGPALCVHLGMSGELRFVPARARIENPLHVHCVWKIRAPGIPGTPGNTDGNGRLVFRDPRRFGGCWLYASERQLEQERFSRLGPDALTIDASTLRAALGRTKRSVKTALLDQALLAGVGNIYADEALFRARVNPLTPGCDLESPAITRLSRAVRAILQNAVDAGGSTIRDYRDGEGRRGDYARRHLVYGRGGEPCVRCGEDLQPMVIGQRSCVFCPRCQPMGD